MYKYLLTFLQFFLKVIRLYPKPYWGLLIKFLMSQSIRGKLSAILRTRITFSGKLIAVTLDNTVLYNTDINNVYIC